MNNDVSKEYPENFDGSYVNDPIYLLARYRAYCDIVDDDEKKHYEKIEGIGEE